MSTRGAIARGDATKWTGVYHHGDSYPTTLGRTLWALYHGHFRGDQDAMMNHLIDDHPAGWSTIVDRDFGLPVQRKPDMSTEVCLICGGANWEHYQQNYRHPELNVLGLPTPPEDAMVLGHRPKAVTLNNPQCYCHGRGSEPDLVVTQANASAMGVEYAYVFAPDRHGFLMLSSYSANGVKMIGMFGLGDPKATWRVRTRVDFAVDSSAKLLYQRGRN